MSWSFNIKGTPTGVIEQLVNKPSPQGQNELGVKQFNSIRDGLIEQVRTIRNNGLPPRADGVVVAGYGHANDDGTGNFGATVSLTQLAPPPVPVAVHEAIIPATTGESAGPATTGESAGPATTGESAGPATTGDEGSDPVA
jgi:hypothetical protein